MSTLTRRLALTAPLALAACSAPQSGAQRYTGLYEVGFERQAFTDDASGETWWVTLSPQAQEAMRAARPAGATTPFGWRIRAEVEGVLSAEGSYGHLGAYKRQLAITRVLGAKLEPKP
jgi:hypothetical protein